MKLFNGDCLDIVPTLAAGSVDLICCDPPYGNMKGIEKGGCYGDKHKNRHDWDIAIDPIRLFEFSNHILRKNGKLILFSQEPYTSQLITKVIASLPFSYRMIWEKDHFANSLLVNKAPVGLFEDVLVFTKRHPKNELEGRNCIRDYFLQERAKTCLSYKEINKECFKTASSGGGMASNILTPYKIGWTFPTKEKYEALQKIGICLQPYSSLEKENRKLRDNYLSDLSVKFPNIFNLWDGKAYKSNILKYKKDRSNVHPTQKPVALIEDLVKTYSNKGDLVLDFCAGSMTTGIACHNTGRRCILIEKDSEIFKVGKQRLENETRQMKLFDI